LLQRLEGKKPTEDCEKGGRDSGKTKAELIQYLKDSFDYSNRGLDTLTTKPVRPHPRPLCWTDLASSVVAVCDITDRYEPFVENLRMNGRVPPMTHNYRLMGAINGGIRTSPQRARLRSLEKHHSEFLSAARLSLREIPFALAIAKSFAQAMPGA